MQDLCLIITCQRVQIDEVWQNFCDKEYVAGSLHRLEAPGLEGSDLVSSLDKIDPRSAIWK